MSRRASPAMAMILCAAVMIIDGYDLTAMPVALPHAARDWMIEPSRFGWALSAVLVGLGAGAVLVAPIGDRIGRRPAILVSLIGIALATLGTATAGSVAALIVWRLLTGLALGACLPNVTALASELAPPARRAGVLTLVSCGISLGGVGAGLLAPTLVASAGWRGIFLGPGAFTLVLAAVLALWLPESPRFVAGATDRTARPSLLLPLASAYRGATLLFVGLYTLNALALYMLNGWLPTLLPGAGFSLDAAARFNSLAQGGGIVAGLILSWLLDKGRASAALVGAYLLVIGGLATFSVIAPSILAWGVLIVIVGGGIAGAHLAIMALGAGFYPPHLLSSVIGLAVAVARIGAIAGPLIGSHLIASGMGAEDFFLAMVPAVAACAVLAHLIGRVTPHQDDAEPMSR